MNIEAQLKFWIKNRYSDIYLLPRDHFYQIAGQSKKGFQILSNLNLSNALTIINFFKYAGGLNLGENRRPQMGAMEFKGNLSFKIFIRISTIGDFQNQESLVLRLIYPIDQQLNFFRPQDLQNLEYFTKRRGLILFSGPTGSGKTTMIYFLARKLALKAMVMTIEDPVEIYEPLFFQTQVNLAAKMTYPELIKASLRHRPDILIIGEIRDETSAHAAITAALSGHLVFSTIHARNIYGVIERLRDFNLGMSTIKNCLNAICYQRLIPDRNQRIQAFTQVFNGFNSNYQLTEAETMMHWKNQLFALLKAQKITLDTYERYRYG